MTASATAAMVATNGRELWSRLNCNFQKRSKPGLGCSKHHARCAADPECFHSGPEASTDHRASVGLAQAPWQLVCPGSICLCTSLFASVSSELLEKLFPFCQASTRWLLADAGTAATSPEPVRYALPLSVRGEQSTLSGKARRELLLEPPRKVIRMDGTQLETWGQCKTNTVLLI